MSAIPHETTSADRKAAASYLAGARLRKAAVKSAHLGLMASRVRLPLVEVSEPTQTEVAAVLAWACEIHADDMIGTMGARPQVGVRAAS
jgi:hypothetical protein